MEKNLDKEEDDYNDGNKNVPSSCYTTLIPIQKWIHPIALTIIFKLRITLCNK
jgi:hypothetical protein